MGNTGSKDRQNGETVDFGSLSPQGVYTGPQDWNQQVVGHLIVDRKLAPFYRPLEEYDETWDDEHILAARRGNPDGSPPPPESPTPASSTSSKFHNHKNSNRTGKEPFRPTEASVYRGAIECPICFLYYPPNINRSRCCDQAICTECFVQIKRAEPTTTHLVSEPASCPYCVQENFGVTYSPPSWRSGLMKDGQMPPTPTRLDMPKLNSAPSESASSKRRKSFNADSPDVVTIDQIRPDWEAKLAAVRAAVTRRANRRIIMRQVGDRLIPIGVTSGRVIEAGDAAANAEGVEGGSGRRRRRGHGGQDLNHILGSVGLGGLGGQDLEELMVMEAMRLSLMEHEEQQRRQNTSGNNDSTQNASGNLETNGNNASPARSPSPSPQPSPHPSVDSPTLLRTPSPAANDQSPLQNSLSTSLSLTHSPLGSFDSAPSSLAPPTRTHRRTGSSPNLPSGNTLAAALSATQTAAAFLNPSEGRQTQPSTLPRSAPQTRAASPVRRGHELEREVSVRHANEEQLVTKPECPPSVVVHPSEGPSESEPTASTSGLERSLTLSLASDGGGDMSSQSPAEYQALASSTESSDPLLGWDK